VSTVRGEVLAENVRVLADVAKVDGTSSRLEKEQTIEVLEEHGVRLMDGTEDGLTGSGEFAEETDDVVGGLAVETAARKKTRGSDGAAKGERRRRDARSGLVEEEEKLGLRGEFDTDSNTLASLDIESETRETDHGVSLVLELEKLDDFLDLWEGKENQEGRRGWKGRRRKGKKAYIGVLLLLRHRRGLTEVGRESEGFADRLRVLVRVLLLNVGGSTLELATGNATSNETLSTDDTDGLAVGENL
jgi:hypothetical protein